MSKTALQFLAGFGLCGALIAAGVACSRCSSQQEPAPTPPATVAQAATVQEEAPAPPPADAPPAWLKKQPGVAYTPPRRVPEVIHQKYQTFEEGWDVAQEGGGEFVQTADGPAYQLAHLDEGSSFARMGLRPGDQVISVNGQPIGTSLRESKALFEALRSEKKLAILIERDGKRQVLTFTVEGQ